MWAVVGDATTSGGKVITGSPFTDIEGRPVARVTDKATCPQHQGAFPIVDGDVSTTVDGHPVALHGSALACGCRIVAVVQPRVFLDPGSEEGRSLRPAVTRPQDSILEAAAGLSTGCDEQIEFLGPTGEPLANIAYTLHLADGTILQGTADQEGRSARVHTEHPVAILRAELDTPHALPACCGSLPSAQPVSIDLDGASTSPAGLSTSTHRATTRARDRGLTEGEIALLRPLFGTAVDYSAVKLHNHGYWLLFGFQPDDTATAPNGQIFLPGNLFSADFSRERLPRQHLFVHEMTHVWQYQLGYPLKRIRGVRPNMSYRYELTANKLLCDYNLEAQGNLLADYFLIRFRQGQRNVSEPRYHTMRDVLPLYERTLRDFLSDPAATDNLPKVTE
ncbi:PAAR domain-containing protein [Luteimonas yindakuii]|nr:PAAR domain-containing protein [Luteimonas yindakuii]